MQFTLVQLSAVLGFALTANAHFVLQLPPSLGFDDALEAQGPCGSYDASDRSTGVTDWPIGGSNIAVITTHLNVKWVIRAALISDINNFVALVPVIDQTGFGSVCFSGIPGKADWVGKDAVMQIWQDGVDGILYQCAAIKFVSGGPAAIPGDCTDSAGVTWNFETPLPVSSTTTTSSPPDVSTTASTSTTSPAGPGSSTTTTTSAASSSSGGSSSTSKTTTTGSASSGSSSLGTTSASKTTTKPTVAINATTTATSTKPATFTGSAEKMRAGGAAVFLGGAALLGWLL